MSKYIKEISSLVLLLLIITTATFAENPPRIKVGISLPLTGDLAQIGTDVKNALLFANNKFFSNKYDFIIEDDKCDKKAAISAAHKFTAIDQVGYVMGQVCNATILASAPVYAKAKTLVIASTATSGDVRGIGEKVFRPYPADQDALPVLLEEITGKIKSIGIITEIDEYSDLMERALVNFNDNLPVDKKLKLYIEQVPPGNHDFRASLLKLKQKNVEAFFFNARGDTGYIEMVKQKHTLGITKPHYANILSSTGSVRNALGDLDKGTVFTNLEAEVSTLNKNNQDIYQEFIKAYGEPSSTPFIVLLGMDTLRILDQAINSDLPPEDYLRAVDFSGFSGRIKFDKDGAGIGIKYILQTID